MKKLFYLGVAVLSLAIVSCSKESFVNNSEEAGITTITVSQDDVVETKTHMGDAVEGKRAMTWNTGDEILVMSKDETYSSFFSFSDTDASGRATFVLEDGEKALAEGDSYVALYNPMGRKHTEPHTNQSNAYFFYDVPTTIEYNEGGKIDDNIIPMIGKGTSSDHITMEYPVALVSFKLYSTDSDLDVSSISLSSTQYLAGGYAYNIQEDSYTTNGNGDFSKAYAASYVQSIVPKDGQTLTLSNTSTNPTVVTFVISLVRQSQSYSNLSLNVIFKDGSQAVLNSKSSHSFEFGNCYSFKTACVSKKGTSSIYLDINGGSKINLDQVSSNDIIQGSIVNVTSENGEKLTTDDVYRINTLINNKGVTLKMGEVEYESTTFYSNKIFASYIEYPKNITVISAPGQMDYNNSKGFSLPSGLVELKSYPFYHSGTYTVEIPASLEKEGIGNFNMGCTVNVAEDNPYFTSFNGAWYTKYYTKIIASGPADADGCIEIKYGTTTIGQHSFCYHPTLTKVVIPSTVTESNGGIFTYCDYLQTIECKSSSLLPSSGTAFLHNNGKCGSKVSGDKKIIVPAGKGAEFSANIAWQSLINIGYDIWEEGATSKYTSNAQQQSLNVSNANNLYNN